MSKMDEMIIVAPRSEVFENEQLAFQGTLREPEVVETIMSNIANTFSIMRRGDAEKNFKFKQPIPYAVIQRGNEFFLYERLSGGGEERLHNKLSLGAGGHMNGIEDIESFHDLLMVNLGRELEEELHITDTDFKLYVVGLINDDTDEVGEVHLAVLVTIQVSEDSDVTVRETDQLLGRWISLDELKVKETYDRLENWSKIVVDIL